MAAMVRRKNVVDAINILKFTAKKTSLPLKKLIESAVANAIHNFKQNKDDLYIKEIIVTKGATLKRSVPVSRGRAYPILKRTAHITVILGTNNEIKNPEVKKEITKVKEVKPEKKEPKKAVAVKTPAPKKTTSKKSIK